VSECVFVCVGVRGRAGAMDTAA